MTDKDLIARLTAERDERSAEIARLLMKIERLRKDKLAWQDVATSYGAALDRLRTNDILKEYK